MVKKKPKKRKGFTIAEMAVATALALVVISGTGIVLVDSQRSWNSLYNRVYSDVVTDGHVARRMFDATVRKENLERAYQLGREF